MFLPTEQYEIYLTPIGRDPGPVVQPPGSGWDLVNVLDHSGMFLWRRSRIYGEFELAETEQAEGRHRMKPKDRTVEGVPGVEIVPLDSTSMSSEFAPPRSQRQRLKIPKGVLDD